MAETVTNYVTLPGVEIVASGTWLSGRGPETVTSEDLDAMVAAAADPEIDHAALRIGHIDPRFDGEPALGWLSNVRRQGDRIVADIVDVPAKLAATVRGGFRRRSAEFLRGVTTPSGKKYSAALTGLALLGVTAPAVKGLADVLSRYSALIGSGLVAMSAESATAVTIEDPPLPSIIPAGDVDDDATWRQHIAAHFDELPVARQAEIDRHRALSPLERALGEIH